jgi:hypothetical protein
MSEYLNVAEAAKFANLGASTLNKKRLTGGGPEYLKIGRRVVYPRDSFEAWLRSHQRTSTSDTGAKAT